MKSECLFRMMGRKKKLKFWGVLSLSSIISIRTTPFFSGKCFEFFFAQTSGKSTQTYPKTFSAQTHFSPPLGPRASEILKFSKKRYFTPKTPRPWKNFPGKKRQQNIYTCFSTDLLGTQSYENFNSE